MLAVAALGVLFEPYAPAVHAACGAVSVCMLALVLAKIVRYPHLVRVDLRSPVFGAVAGTFPMTLLELGTYLRPLSMQAAFAVWVVGLAVFAVLVGNSLFRFAASDGKADFLTPASFVVLIGPLLAVLTGTGYGADGFCAALFWAGLAVALVDVVAVTVAWARRPMRIESLRPLNCIYAAPFSMTLACLLVVCPDVPLPAVALWYGCACGLFAFAFVHMLRCLRLRFYPSYASMTFPFVISATATLEVASYLAGLGLDAGAIQAFGFLQMGLASCLTAYVLVRFCLYLASFAPDASPRP